MKDHAQQIVEHMLAHDAFSRWLGITVLALRPGYCAARMQVRPEMVNGFGLAHGGITFSLADSALAFASNSHGRKALSVDTSINHLKPVRPGDELRAEATEEHLGERLAHYRISVHNQRDELVALFRGMVYRRQEEWPMDTKP